MDRTRSVLLFGALATLLGIGWATPACAAPTYYWTGTGTWGLSNSWSSTSGSGYTLAWAASNSAVFEGTAGTVTVSSNQQAASIQFTTDGYLLSGGSVTLTASGGSITTGRGQRRDRQRVGGHGRVDEVRQRHARARGQPTPTRGELQGRHDAYRGLPTAAELIARQPRE